MTTASASAPTAPAARSGFDPRWLPLIVTTVGSFMSILDSNIVNIALPSILKDFNAGLGSGQLVIASYVMALAIVIPLSGFLGERVGMKRLYMFTIAFFTLGSVLCGLAWNVESLIFFRVLQGLGGGMLQPLGMAIVFTMITPMERPKFIAMLGLPVLIAPIIGPSVGGYIVQYSSWRMVFLINLPVGVLDVVLAYFLLKETQIRTDTRMDFKGFGLAAVAFPCLLMGLSQGTSRGWLDPLVLGLIAVGAVAFAAFVRVELKHKDPMLRLQLFANPTFRLALIVQWIGLFCLFGLNFVIPLFLQRVRGMGAAEAGRVLLPMGIVAFTTMNIAGKLYYKLGPRPLIVAGLVVLAVTSFGWSLATPTTSIPLLLLIVSGRGLGLGLYSQVLQVVAFNSVPEGQMPRATALVNVAQRVSTAFVTAILTSVLIVTLVWLHAPAGTSISSGNAPVSLMSDAFRYAFWLMTGVCIVGVLVSTRLRDRVWEAHHDGQVSEKEAASVEDDSRLDPELSAGG